MKKNESRIHETSVSPSEVWHRHLGERSRSADYNVVFVWQSHRLYVMDNHRVAMWCWWRHLSQAGAWQLLHIDRHYDTLSSQLAVWVREVEQGLKGRDPKSVPLDAYLNLTYDCGGGLDAPVISWGNYLSIFLAMHNKQLTRVVFATEGEGDEPACCGLRLEELDPNEILRLIEAISREDEYSSEAPWLVNVDLDYFTERISGERAHQRFSDEYIAGLGHALVTGLRRNRIGCATIALSPETTGGWAKATNLMRRLLRSWGRYPHV